MKKVSYMKLFAASIIAIAFISCQKPEIEESVSDLIFTSSKPKHTKTATMFGAQIPTLYGLDGGERKWYASTGETDKSDIRYLFLSYSGLGMNIPVTDSGGAKAIVARMNSSGYGALP